MGRFPETMELAKRLVMTAKSYLVNEVYKASPRDFYIAQHVLAAKILLNIRRKILSDFAKEGSLSPHSIEELDTEYITKQLLGLNAFTPSLAKGWKFVDFLKPPRMKNNVINGGEIVGKKELKVDIVTVKKSGGE